MQSGIDSETNGDRVSQHQVPRAFGVSTIDWMEWSWNGSVKLWCLVWKDLEAHDVGPYNMCYGNLQLLSMSYLRI
jgi:hypothetical protein